MSEALIDRPMMSQLITLGALSFLILTGWAIWKSVKLYRSIRQHRAEMEQRRADRLISIQRLSQPL